MCSGRNLWVEHIPLLGGASIVLKSLRRLLSARQVMAGKSIEEIKEEGLKELAANPSAYKVLDKQPTSSLENISGTPVPTPASIPVSTSPM